MELRKIQKTRGGTFFVTVPKEWAIKNGISRGSVVSTSVSSDGHLVIDPKYNLEQIQSIATVIPGPYLSREIIGKYLLGYDIIQIKAKDRISMSQRETVKDTSTRLIGLEIIEEDYSKIVMQSVLEPSAFPPSKILRREYLITSGMYRDTITALSNFDVQLARSIIARDNEVDRLYFLLVRILRTVIQNPGLSEKLDIHPIDCLDYRLTASFVESIGDLSSQISEYVLHIDNKYNGKILWKPIKSLHQVVYKSYENAITAFLVKDIEGADLVRDQRDLVIEKQNQVTSVCKTIQAEIAQKLAYIVSLIVRIYYYSVDISDLTTPRN